MTMPKDVVYGGERPEDESLKKAKGKNGSSFTNDLFASIENFFYEFGLISKPSSKKGNTEETGPETHKQSEPDGDDYGSSDYSEDEVLLSQYNKIGQQYWGGSDGQEQSGTHQLSNRNDDDYMSQYYSEDEVLLSQYNTIGQQYWGSTDEQGEGGVGYSDSHIEV
ncbi:hypothetical protein ASZ90_017229 [hydrocarbon metagenome]|uniref:Uncharacterized protein n=1 Tax=hydrocarbon metagenome TaxID=938273 RepID=A0A0W8E9R0_9ZZZZ